MSASIERKFVCMLLAGRWVDCVMIDPAYDGHGFNVALVWPPKSKNARERRLAGRGNV